MADQPKENEKPATPENKKAADGTAPSKSGAAGLMMKRILGYAMMGLAPLVAVVALVVAVLAMMGNQSIKTQIGKDAATIESLNANLSASKAEVEKLKAAMLKDAALQNEKIKKQEERTTLIVQSITPLQTKLKISPTLDAQLSGGVIAAVPVPTITHPPVVVPPPAHEVKPVAPKTESKPKSVAPAKPHEAAHAEKSKPHTTGNTPADSKQLSPQVKAMKEAIERFNKP